MCWLVFRSRVSLTRKQGAECSAEREREREREGVRYFVSDVQCVLSCVAVWAAGYFYPGVTRMRRAGRYQYKTREGDTGRRTLACNHDSRARPTAAPGIFIFTCPHGVVLGYGCIVAHSFARSLPRAISYHFYCSNSCPRVVDARTHRECKQCAPTQVSLHACQGERRNSIQCHLSLLSYSYVPALHVHCLNARAGGAVSTCAALT